MDGPPKTSHEPEYTPNNHMSSPSPHNAQWESHLSHAYSTTTPTWTGPEGAEGLNEDKDGTKVLDFGLKFWLYHYLYEFGQITSSM